MSNAIQAVSSSEEQQIREYAESWIVPSNAAVQNGRLHVNANGEPLCERDYTGSSPMTSRDARFKEKPIAVYPPGYRPICKYCAQTWREVRDGGD